MIVYIPASAAQVLSDALWALSRPRADRGPKDTQYLFPWVNDTAGNRWLVVDTEYEIRVHDEAELGSIADILAPFVGHGLTQADIDGLAAYVISSRGQKITVYSAFPQFFKDQAKTWQQMIDAGLLAQLEGVA